MSDLGQKGDIGALRWRLLVASEPVLAQSARDDYKEAERRIWLSDNPASTVEDYNAAMAEIERRWAA